MIAKLFATEGSTETSLARFTFETTFKEAEKLGTFAGDDEFFIVKADKYIGTLDARITLLESGQRTASCASDDVFKIFEGMKEGAKVKLVCIASE